MTALIRSTPPIIPLLKLLTACLIFALSPLVTADWKFHDYSPITPSRADNIHMSRAAMTISFRDSALTFSIEENNNNGQIKWLGMFTSPQAMKSLNSIKTTNINPFDSSQAIVLNTRNPRSGMMGDGRMVIAFSVNYTDLKALSKSEGKLLVVNYDSHSNTDAVHFELSNYARALKQFEEYIKRAGMQHILTD